MTLMTRLLGRIGHLPRASTHKVLVEKDLRTKTPDGIELLADHYYAKDGGEKDPIVLVRTPYGRSGITALLMRTLAERGYQLVLQSVRGTAGSGGKFDPTSTTSQASDGIATMKWLKDQKWFSGKVAMTGASYLSVCLWAIATSSPPEYLMAIVPSLDATDSRMVFKSGGSFAYDMGLATAYLWRNRAMVPQTGDPQPGALKRTLALVLVGLSPKVNPAFGYIPVGKADELVFGSRDETYQRILEAVQSDLDLFDDQDLSKRVKDVTIPAHLVDGWYDVMLPGMLKDYASLKASGRNPYLTIGPWTHLNPRSQFVALKESIAWFDVHLRGDASKLRKDPVSVYVMGKNRWLGLSDWPPREMRQTRWYLLANRVLADSSPPDGQSPDSYDYDPKNPTPSVGGSSLGGQKDNRGLESRADVLCYTSAAFDMEYTIIGPVSADLYVKSSLRNTDFFARLCDVYPRGKSINICDGIMSLRPSDFDGGSDGTAHITFDLWPTAHCFLVGHRMRLQVSSGSHPRFLRNLGSGEPIATATTFRVAHQEIMHDSMHPSSVLLPVYEGVAGKQEPS